MGVLPTVVALQLEVGLRGELAESKSQRVMLTQVVVGSVTSAVVDKNAAISMFLGDDVDNACHRIAAIECALGSFDDFYLLDVMRINKSKIVLTTHITMNAFAVDKNQDVVVAQTVQLHLRAHVTLVEGKRGGEACKDILQTLTSILAQHLVGDDLGLHRRILQKVAGSSTRHDYLL